HQAAEGRFINIVERLGVRQRCQKLVQRPEPLNFQVTGQPRRTKRHHPDCSEAGSIERQTGVCFGTVVARRRRKGPKQTRRELDQLYCHSVMTRIVWMAAFVLLDTAGLARGQVQNFKPVTDQMLENPSPDDWLMFSRTYDAQRFSPLKQINKQNVGQLRMAWTRGMGPGQTETIPIVHNGVMYVVNPGAVVQALDATNGNLLWEYKRPAPANAAAQGRTKSLAIYEDIVAYTAPDSFVVGLDARTGEPRWQTKVDARGNTSGPLIVEGRVISGGACAGNRANCYISAHDALTGKEVWRFYTTPAPGEPGDESWNGAFLERRLASTWGLPGAYDPMRKMLYWGIANPMPDQRAQRHDGNPDGTSRSAPAALYSNSTIALDPNTGKLAWYYQHL